MKLLHRVSMVLLIVGLVGCDHATKHIAQAELQGSLRDYLERRLVSELRATINGNPTSRVANTTNLSFSGAGAEAMLIALDLEGIAVSTGAACTAGASDPSHVLLAMGNSRAVAGGSIRFSLGAGTTEAEVTEVLEILPEIASRLKRAGPAL